MELEYTRVAQEGFRGTPARVYLLTGSDDGVKREALQRLVEPLLDPAFADFDREDLDIGVTPLSDGNWATRILASAAGMPMFSERRIVVATNAQRLSKEEQDAVASGLTGLCERTCLVLIAAAPEYDGGKVKGRAIGAKLQAAVSKAGVVVICDAPQAADLKSRAAAIVRAAGKTAEPAALDIAVRRAVTAAAGRGSKGGDVHVLANELEKAIAYSGSRPQVTRADMVAVGTVGAEENIFAMLDAVGKRDVVAAMSRVDEILRTGDRPDGVAARCFVMLARHFRLLWAARFYGENKIGPGFKGTLSVDMQAQLTSEMQGLAMRQSFLLTGLQAQARSWSYQQLRAALMRILASDMTMKGIPAIRPIGYTGNSGEDPAGNLRQLVAELCRV
ncbi:MAG: DNA polymerase III subunit delta [Capsulimonadaceae bacterium]